MLVRRAAHHEPWAKGTTSTLKQPAEQLRLVLVDDDLDEAANVCCASKRVQKRGSPLRPTHACSAGSEGPAPDCVEKRDPHRDDSSTVPTTQKQPAVDKRARSEKQTFTMSARLRIGFARCLQRPPWWSRNSGWAREISVDGGSGRGGACDDEHQSWVMGPPSAQAESRHKRKQNPFSRAVCLEAHVNELGRVLLARLQHQVERCLGRAAEAGEARLSEDMPQPAFAGLRAKPQLHVLRQ
jgi:hypothetical protein